MMTLLQDNAPVIIAVIFVLLALVFTRRDGIEKGIHLGRTQVLREYYQSKERRL